MRRARLVFALVAAACGGGGGGDGDDDGSGGSADAGEAGDEGAAANCDETWPTRRVRRLSHVEYERTIQDLVGLEITAELAPDNVVDGYANDAEALTVTGLLADQYRVAAETIAAAMLEDTEGWLPCDAAAGDSACAEAFLLEFGRRAFRRPVTDDERTRYLALFDDVAGEDGFAEGMRWLIASLLQSPAFLYRTELGVEQDDGTFVLDSHEIATMLAYLVTGTMPDEPLAADADADALHDGDVLVGHATRLATSEEALAPLSTFVEAWLRTGQLDLVTRDPEVYPELTPAIRLAMRGETRRVVADVFASGGTFADLLTAEESFVTDELAAYYGVTPGDGDGDAEGFRRTSMGEHRRGVLTHGSVLATHSLPQSSSPIHRGLLVRERLLCNDLPPPPPGVVNEAPAVDPNVPTRDRYAMHSVDPSCAGCHQLLDPIGFGFEHYDGIGRWRDEDGGVAVDASGVLTGGADGAIEFDGAIELASVLAETSEAQACWARQWSTFALGGLVQDPGLECVADEVAAGLASADGRLDAAVIALVSSPGFVRRRADGDAPMPDDDGALDGSTGAAGETTGADPSTTGGEPAQEIEVTIVQTGLWADGECNEVTVTNLSNTALAWEVRLALMGTITTVWNAVATPDGDDTRFTGAPHNAMIEPAAAAQFGFCLAY